MAMVEEERGPERIRIHPLCRNNQRFSAEEVASDFDSPTYYELFQRGRQISGDGPCLGKLSEDKKSYNFLTYNEVHDHALAIGSALRHRGIMRDNGRNIGIYSQNRTEWDVTLIATTMYGYTVVPLYETLGAENIEYIIENTDIKIVFCDTEEKLMKLYALRVKCSQLKQVVLMNQISEELLQKLNSHSDFAVFTYQQFELLGKENLVGVEPSKPDDLFCIMYTSGTTGVPKGAMIDNKALVTSVCNCYVNEELAKDNQAPADASSCYLSYLPQAHIMNQLLIAYIFSIGGRIGYFGGDIKNIIDDMQVLKPTIFASVPRFFTRIYSKIWESVEGSFIKRYILKKACESKMKKLMQGNYNNNTLADKLVFNKIRQLFGGNVIYMVTGSAPLSTEVIGFLRCCFTVSTVEGYGQTEATGTVTLTVTGDLSDGHVGIPVASLEIKLIDVEELGYYASEDKGEICYRGDSCFKGYWKNPEKTSETIDADGWVHSGDIGMWVEDGNLKIIDRIKHIFKLSQGEYIAPEKLEIIYGQAPLIAQIFVHGDSLENCLVAIVVPEEEAVMMLAQNNSINASFGELCKEDQLKDEILSQIKQQWGSHNLNSLEMPKDIYLSPELFSIENSLLTPTLKSRRHLIKKRYQQEIQAMYQKFH